MESDYLTPYQLCKRWANAVTPKTLANWRAKKEGPPYVRIMGRVLYRKSDVLVWERAGERLREGNAATAA